MANLLDTLAGALAPTMRDMAANFGATVKLLLPADTSAADGSPVRVYTEHPDLGEISAFFRILDARTRETLFGVRSGAVAALTLPRQPAGLPVVVARDGVEVCSGIYTGSKWVAEADGIPDPAGLAVTVALISAPAGAF